MSDRDWSYTMNNARGIGKTTAMAVAVKTIGAVLVVRDAVEAARVKRDLAVEATPVLNATKARGSRKAFLFDPDAVGVLCLDYEAEISRLRSALAAMEKERDEWKFKVQDKAQWAKTMRQSYEDEIAVLRVIAAEAEKLPAYQDRDSQDWFCAGNINGLWEAIDSYKAWALRITAPVPAPKCAECHDLRYTINAKHPWGVSPTAPCPSCAASPTTGKGGA